MLPADSHVSLYFSASCLTSRPRRTTTCRQRKWLIFSIFLVPIFSDHFNNWVWTWSSNKCASAPIFWSINFLKIPLKQNIVLAVFIISHNYLDFSEFVFVWSALISLGLNWTQDFVPVDCLIRSRQSRTEFCMVKQHEHMLLGLN